MNFRIKNNGWVLALLLMLLPWMTEGQTKKEVMFSLDTLYKTHLKLSDDYRKLIDDVKQYDTFYQYVKQAMLDKDFVNEPIEKGIVLFDEVWQAKVAHVRLLEDSVVFLVDSLSYLAEQYEKFSKQSELYLRLLNRRLYDVAYPHVETELVGSWQLFLNLMQLSGEAYNSGLISHNPFIVADSLQQYNIFRIDFLPDELATIHFRGGRTQKCFYEVIGFDFGKPYIIKCSKQDEFKMTIHVSPMPAGLEVSYEIPLNTSQVLYFNGLMKPGVSADKSNLEVDQAVIHVPK